MHRCSSEPSSKLRARSASRRYIYIYTYARVVLLHIAVFSRRLQVSVYICTHHVCCVTMHLSLSLSLCVQVVDFLRRQIHRDSVVRHIETITHTPLSLSLFLYTGSTRVSRISLTLSRMCTCGVYVCVFHVQFVYLHSAFAPCLDERVSSLYSTYSVENMLVVHYACKPAWG